MGSTTCPQCGAVNPAGAKFCGGCGLNMTQKLRQSVQLNPSPTGAIPAPTSSPPGSGPLGTQGIGSVGTGVAPTVVQGAGQNGVPPQGAVAQALTGQVGLHILGPGVTLQSGRYVIDRALGGGGMGSVYLASDTHVNNKRVVIKEMANVYASEAERREAEADFQAEMATLAALSHPNIPQISDFFTESNRHFAVQEYVTGEDLQKAIQAAQVAGQPPRGLPEKQVLGWVTQVLSVLDYLEQQDPQVIHRDIKPANIIVDAANRVRVVDFGIASHKYRPGAAHPTGQQASTALGTPGYAPREQFSGQETPLSDLYALGATTHHLLTGRDPTKAQPLFAYPPMRTLNPKISEPTEHIVARALQNDPPKRYQSATEMKRDVDRVLNPPGVLDTGRGRAIALLVVLFLLIGTGGGAYVYSRIQNQSHPASLVSSGAVALDTDQTDLGSLGVSFADGQAWAAAKTQAAADMASGKTSAAMDGYARAIGLNQADAESYVYREDNSVLAHDKHPYKIAIGGSFGPAPDGSADDVSVGRQNLQGAYVAQQDINDHGGINGHLLYLVIANDASTKDGAATASQQAAAQSDLLALVGFAYSSRTRASLPFIAQSSIPEIAPTASNPGLATSSSYFFRTCPSDTEQGKVGFDYLLNTLLKGKAHPTVAIVGDPNDAYAGGLQTLVLQEARLRGATAISETYTIGQQDFSTIANDVAARRVDAVYFAGYAKEALLLSQAMDGAGIDPSVPIMSDDGFYKPQEYLRNGTPKGRFHFTAYFFPDQWSVHSLTPDESRAIRAMEGQYTGYFFKPGARGGYGTNRVSADTALYYDAVETVAYALRHVTGPATRQSLQQALGSIGSPALPAYAGISGHIRYATSSGSTGDPVNKALVVMYLDAARGRSHLESILNY